MAWESAFGDKPASIPVYLAYDDPDQAFDTSREEYVRGGLVHRCDGETCSIRLIDGKNYSREPAPCPYANETYVDSKERPCQPIGKLRVIVPELRRIGVLELGTHSIHDIVSLSSNISLYALLARQAGRPLSGIPFILARREREISTPSGTNGRARRKVSLVCLDIDPRWAVAQLASRERELAIETANAMLQLPAGVAIDATDPDDEPERAVAIPRPTPPKQRIANQQPVESPGDVPLATPAQVKAIYNIGRDAGLSESQVDERSVEVHGYVPAELGRGQASEFITALKAGKPEPVTKTPATTTAPDGRIAARWRELTDQIPIEALDGYFIPKELPGSWDPGEAVQAGKAMKAFVEAWKERATADQLTAIATDIVEIRNQHGEVPGAVGEDLPLF